MHALLSSEHDFYEDRKLLRHIRDTFFLSHTWLVLGVILIAYSLSFGYHQYQRSAEAVLHKKAEKPAEVLIQNFVSERHINSASEVRVLGEVMDGEEVVLNLGDEEAPQWLRVIPILAVGTEAQPVAAQHVHLANELKRRPMPRNNAAGLGRQRRTIAMLRNQTLAYAIQEVPSQYARSRIRSGAGLEVLAATDAGRLVRFVGSVHMDSDSQNALAAKLEARGMIASHDMLIVRPDASLAANGLADQQVAGMPAWLLFAGVLSTMLSFALPGVMRSGSTNPRRPSAADEPGTANRQSVARFFQPIATQDELSLEERRGSVARNGRGPVAEIVRQLRVFVLVRLRIKNPR